MKWYHTIQSAVLSTQTQGFMRLLRRCMSFGPGMIYRAVLFLFLVCTVVLNAQFVMPKRIDQMRLGVFIGAQAVQHTADFSSLTGFPSCNPRYDNGGGSSSLVGASIEISSSPALRHMNNGAPTVCVPVCHLLINGTPNAVMTSSLYRLMCAVTLAFTMVSEMFRNHSLVFIVLIAPI